MEDRTLLLFKSDSVPVIPDENKFNSESEPKLIIDPFNFFKTEIDKLLALEENWDGYEGLPVYKEIGATAQKLLTITGYFDGISDIFPNPHGTLTIEWTNIRKEKLSLEIGLNSYSYFVKNIDKTPKLVDGKDILKDTETLTKDLGEIFSEEVLNFIL